MSVSPFVNNKLDLNSTVPPKPKFKVPNPKFRLRLALFNLTMSNISVLIAESIPVIYSTDCSDYSAKELMLIVISFSSSNGWSISVKFS